MNKPLVAAALAVAFVAVPYASPASASTGTVLRNVLILAGAAVAAIGIKGFGHKKHVAVERESETERRQASYKAYYYRKTGSYPTPEQIHAWYVKTYGTQPAG
jgi:hypothetical protein